MDQKLKQYGWFMAKFYSLIMRFSNNSYVIDEFKSRVSHEKKVLEIGSGIGKDYQILKETYDITGSDYSDSFLNTLKKKFDGDKFLKLNAVTMEVDSKYDVIYSNKVLHHLLPDQLEESFRKQYEILSDGGILFHTMWKGDKKITDPNKLYDIAYEKDDIERIKGKFRKVDFIVYKELKEADSFITILEK